MAKYLVTGGAGFIGSNLVEALGAGGDKVVVYDDFRRGQRRNLQDYKQTEVRVVEGDVRDAKTLKRAERRGTTAHRKATRSEERPRGQHEREVRKQRKSVEKQVKATNKDLNKQIEDRVDVVTKRAEKAQAEISKRAEVRGQKAQDLVNRVTDQLTQLV